MNKRKAFTLIELLVVIAIIGILSGLIVISMGGVTNKAKVAKAQVFNNSLRSAIMINTKGDWSLDGTPDDTWNHFAGTAMATPVASTDCPQNTCYTFNGSTQYMTTPNTGGRYSIGTNPMTAMIWVKGVSQTKTFFADWDTNATYKQAWKIASSGTSLRVVLSDTTTQTTQKDYSTAAADVALDNNWHLVGFTWSGPSGTLTLYIDGAAISDSSLTKTSIGAVANITANPAGVISIACDMANNVATNFFNGSLDSARLYNAAIPTSQIKEQYYAGLNSLLSTGKISATEYARRTSNFSLNK
jgi:prepilin-type N-terminal cleavage/methylation domain-containing protein